MRTVNQILRNCACGWKPYGFLPSEVTIQDWGCVGCRRLVLVLTFSGVGGAHETFLDEGMNTPHAEALKARYEAILDREWVRA